MEYLARRFFISGRVQGVGFRFFVERVAVRLGVAGFVKNCFDGRVEVYAICDAAQLDSLRDELRRGPRMASVSEVKENAAEIDAQYSHGFSIEHND